MMENKVSAVTLSVKCKDQYSDITQSSDSSLGMAGVHLGWLGANQPADPHLPLSLHSISQTRMSRDNAPVAAEKNPAVQVLQADPPATMSTQRLVML